MQRTLAIIERDMRKFFHSPTLMFVTMFFPLMQLLVLGHAFGGQIKNVTVGLVDEDRGSAARELRKMFTAIEANAKTFRPHDFPDLRTAEQALRAGHIHALIHIPANFSRDLYAQNRPRIALVLDNTDTIRGNAVAERLRQLVAALNQPEVNPRLVQQAQVEIVELYAYVPYIKYLLPGSVTMAIFMTSIIGGGIIFIDDRARGLHEGYLVTPIRGSELVLGLTLAGALKGVMTGMVSVIIGSLIAGVEQLYDPLRLLYLLLVVAVSALAFISFTFFIMVRVEDPLVPRSIIGILVTLLFFPSGAIYPTEGFPAWLKWISVVDPLTYAVHSLRSLLLKHAGLAGIYTDLLYLLIFSLLMLAGSILLFRRTV